jgi:hypothetical protein
MSFATMILALQMAHAAATPAALKLPEARSNIAVATVAERYLCAANGLAAGKSRADTRQSGWCWDQQSGNWQSLPPLPGAKGRLGSAAIGLKEEFCVFGGYEIADDDKETTTNSLHCIKPGATQWRLLSAHDRPTDDGVLLNYQDRWILLVSGWRDDRNVRDVSALDSQNPAQGWYALAEYPGEPVFGHAGAIAGDQLVICDGVTAKKNAAGKNQFALIDACFLGKLSVSAGKNTDSKSRVPLTLTWQALPAHPGPPRYRMAAASQQIGKQTYFYFVGGSERAYNYNGIGYDGKPALASAVVQRWSTSAQQWQAQNALPEARMDLRGLPWLLGRFWLVGGMRDPQQVSAAVTPLAKPQSR